MITNKKPVALFISALLFFINVSTGSNFSLSVLKCKFCKKSIQSRYITQEKNAYHESCYKDHIQLRCDHCKKLIDGTYNLSNDKNYHEKCYSDFILEKCDVCFKPIEQLYVKDNYGNIYHNYHRSAMPLCESCNRIICTSITDGGVRINKGRNVCNLCWEYVINDKSKINRIYKDVRKVLTSIGINNIPEKIPIRLIDSKRNLQKLSKSFLPDGIQGYTKYDYQKIRDKKINEKFTIYILSNLHEINFRAVLAHELMHVYLFINNISLRKSLVEGFCNLGTEYVYRSYPNSKIGQLKLEAMAKDKDPEYGKGYRIMSSELKSIGWKNLISKLEKY